MTSIGMRGRSARSGFTTMGASIGMAALGILASLALPRIDQPERQLATATRASWAALTAARQQAIRYGHDVRVEFDTAHALITIIHDEDGNGVRNGEERATTRYLPREVVFGTVAAEAGAHAAPAVSFGADGYGAPVLVFHADGSASESGGIHLRTTRAAHAAWASEVRLLTVAQKDGRLVGMRLHDGVWQRTF